MSFLRYLGEDSDAGAPAAPFTPLSISSLRLWLDSDILEASYFNGDPINQWFDSSGYNNHFDQATGFKQPTKELGTANNKGVARFDGIDDTLAKVSALSGFGFITGVTLAVVAKVTLITNYGMAVVLKEGLTEMRQYEVSGLPEWFIPNGTTSIQGPNNIESFWVLLMGDYASDDGSLEMWINGASAGSTFDAGTLAAGPSWLGSRGEAYFWNGEIAEVIAYDAPLSVSDRQAVEAYLTAKFGL